jgi:hypothetical protein
VAAGVTIEARTEVIDTLELLSDRWASLEGDAGAQGALLRSMGYKIVARRDAGRVVIRHVIQLGPTTLHEIPELEVIVDEQGVTAMSLGPGT